MPDELEALVAAALDGDANAMGELYGRSAEVIRAGKHPLPEPFATAIADRLQALSQVMHAKPDKGERRAALAAAAAPGRQRGQPKKRLTPHDIEIMAAVIATEHVGSIDERIEAAVEQAKDFFDLTATQSERESQVRRAITALNTRGLGKGMAGKKTPRKNQTDNSS